MSEMWRCTIKWTFTDLHATRIRGDSFYGFIYPASVDVDVQPTDDARARASVLATWGPVDIGAVTRIIIGAMTMLATLVGGLVRL